MDEMKDTERRYQLDVDNIHGSSASLSALVAVRKCYMHRPTDNEHSALDTSPEEHIKEVQGCCAAAADYLLPDTPLKDAVFRVLVARGNEPLTSQDISNDLSERWAASAYPRDLSPRVIEKILDNGANYLIHEMPEPKPDVQLIRRRSAK
jgi:hypothetical protein